MFNITHLGDDVHHRRAAIQVVPDDLGALAGGGEQRDARAGAGLEHLRRGGWDRRVLLNQ